MPSKSQIEAECRQTLEEILFSIPLLRRQGQPGDLLGALLRGIQCFPVFAGWDSPVDGWIAEARELARQIGDEEAAFLVETREALVRMRRLDLESAEAHMRATLERFAGRSPGEQVAGASCLSRIFTRRKQFDSARAAIEGLPALPADDWHGLLPVLAQAEWLLETGANQEAVSEFALVGEKLPAELIEERIQVSQCLAFAAIAEADVRMAIRWLDEAREMLRAAGVWPEVIQSNLTIGSLFLGGGLGGRGAARAKALFEEALEIGRQHQRTEWEPVLKLGIARAEGTQDPAQAIRSALEAARAYANRGLGLGFFGVVVLIHQLQLQNRDYAGAYQTLAVGLSLARRWNVPFMTQILRAHVNHLRDEVLGPRRFDELAAKLAEAWKREKGGASPQ
jgi:tetratricopeptide (TPR) repeat protein